MSKVQTLVAVALLVAMLFVGVAQADCAAYYYLGPGGCCRCPANCRQCYGPNKCHPDFCDPGCDYRGGLCYVTIVVPNYASRVGVYGAVAAVGAALVAALVY